MTIHWFPIMPIEISHRPTQTDTDKGIHKEV